MKFSRKIAPEIKPRQNFITKKRLREDEINFEVDLGFGAIFLLNLIISYS